MSKQQAFEDEVDLRQLFLALWQGKWWIISVTVCAALLSVAYALSLPNIYRAEVVVVPSEEAQGGGLAGLSGQMGGLAALAGVKLGSAGVDKATVALEVLSSKKFLADFIQKYQLKAPLIAAERWDYRTDQLVFNSKLYDETNQAWVREVKSPKQPEPSTWEAVKAFQKDILRVQQDKQTGVIKISIEHYSPTLAAKWVTWLLADLNEYMRLKDQAEAEISIQYLEARLKDTGVVVMQEAISRLIEQQMQVLMLGNVRDEYLFTTVDPAMVPEEKAKPSRVLICIAGTLFGGILGVLIALIRYFWRTPASLPHSK